MSLLICSECSILLRGTSDYINFLLVLIEMIGPCVLVPMLLGQPPFAAATIFYFMVSCLVGRVGGHSGAFCALVFSFDGHVSSCQQYSLPQTVEIKEIRAAFPLTC